MRVTGRPGLTWKEFRYLAEHQEDEDHFACGRVCSSIAFSVLDIDDLTPAAAFGFVSLLLRENASRVVIRCGGSVVHMGVVVSDLQRRRRVYCADPLVTTVVLDTCAEHLLVARTQHDLMVHVSSPAAVLCAIFYASCRRRLYLCLGNDTLLAAYAAGAVVARGGDAVRLQTWK